MDFGPAWWPEGLGQPASSGGQNGVRYAFFPDRRRFAVLKDGAVELHDSGDHCIYGVSQGLGGGGGEPFAFTGQEGEARLDALVKVGWGGGTPRVPPGASAG